MTNHHIGHFRYIGILCCHTSDIAAIPENCHSVRKRLYLMHLMCNNDNCLTIVSHLSEHMKKLLCFLGRQYGGRFIENQNIRSPVKYLHYLHRLLLGNGHVINLLCRIYLKTILSADFFYLCGSLLDVKFSGKSENNVLRC